MRSENLLSAQNVEPGDSIFFPFLFSADWLEVTEVLETDLLTVEIRCKRGSSFVGRDEALRVYRGTP